MLGRLLLRCQFWTEGVRMQMTVKEAQLLRRTRTTRKTQISPLPVISLAQTSRTAATTPAKVHS